MARLLYPDAGPVRLLGATDAEATFSVQNGNGGRYAMLVRDKPDATTITLSVNVDGEWAVTDEVDNDKDLVEASDGTYGGAIVVHLAPGNYRMVASEAGPTVMVGMIDP